MPVIEDIETLLGGLERADEIQQNYLLSQVLKANLRCEYAKRYRFDRIKSVRDYQQSVPIITHADIAEDIERMAQGDQNILVAQPVRRFFATSGSTSAAKLIPVTSRLIADKSRAFGVYWELLFKDHPGAKQGRVVGNFSDSSGAGKVAGGQPITSEGAYWNSVGAIAQKRGRSPIPKIVTRISDADSRYYTIARILVEEDVSLFMALNPSTLLLLLRKLDEFSQSIIQDVETGGLSQAISVSEEVRAFIASHYSVNRVRARQLEQLQQNTGLLAPALWPALKLMVSWRSPMLQPYLRLLEPHFAEVAQRDYILMASEGVIAIPTEDHCSGGMLATPFCFYEFIPEEEIALSNPNVLLAGELEVGRCYVVLLSTSAGLYRYNIGDVIRVTDIRGSTPWVEFIHRAGSTCSITGEKLTETQVIEVLEVLSVRLGLTIEDSSLQPSFTGFPHYALLVEFIEQPDTDLLRRIPAEFDNELAKQNVEYAAKRQSQRLGAPELKVLRPGSYDERRRRRIAGGANDAQIKPTKITRDSDFYRQFEVISTFVAQ